MKLLLPLFLFCVSVSGQFKPLVSTGGNTLQGLGGLVGVTNNSPSSLTLYTVGGDGSGWEDPGLAITLSGSTSGDSYILQRVNGTGYINKDTIEGTGSALNFGAYDTTGTYKVLAYKGATQTRMTDSAVLTIRYYSTATKALFARMDTQPNDTIEYLLATAMDSLATYHILDTLDVFHLYAQHSSAAGLLDWVNTSYNGTIVSNATIIPFRGVAQMKSEGYVNTGYNPTANATHYKLNSASVGMWVLDNMAESLWGGGYTNVGASATTLALGYDGKNTAWISLNETARALTNAYPWNGMLSLSRVSSTKIQGYQNATKITTQASSTSSALPNLNMYVSAYNANGTAGTWTINRKAAFWIGGQLTDNQSLKLYQILNRYLTGVGAIGSEYIFPVTHVDYKPAYADYRPSNIVINQKANYKLAFKTDTLKWSTDGGATWPYKRYFNNTANIQMSYIWDNGTFIIGCDTTLFRSADNLSTLTAVPLMDGASAYDFHAAVSATYPGEYMRIAEYPNVKAVMKNTGGTNCEMLVWGNYGNVAGGACPTNLYYSIDTGKTVKILYKFGIDTVRRDNGASAPSATAGNYVGDPTALYKARHVEGVYFNSTDSCFYVNTGDHYRAYITNGPNEIYWFKLRYTFATDSWTMTKLTDQIQMKAAAMYFYGDSVMWGSDYTFGSQPTYLGVFKMKTSEIGDYTKRIRVWDSGQIIDYFSVYGQQIVIGYPVALGKIVSTSNDFGKTFHTTTMTYLPVSHCFAMPKVPDTAGYWLFTGEYSIQGYYTFYLKVK
jgi:hypothetical protein